jgi:hypothetical protein
MQTHLLIRLAIRIANLAGTSAEAGELCRRAASDHDLPTTRYAQLVLEVARIRSQFAPMVMG